MLKIGDFSKLGQVSIRMLRHYDELDLLKPVAVDPLTGYRYYTMDQLPRLNRIMALKDLGFTLEQVARLLDSDLSPTQIEGMLLMKRAEIERQVRAEQARLTRVELRLRHIQREGTLSQYDVILKEVDGFCIASVREIIPTVNHLGSLFAKLYTYLQRYGVAWSLPNLILWHDSAYREHGVDAETAMSLAVELPGNEQVSVRQLPATQMATVVHQGGYDTVGQAYEAIGHWIEASRCQISGATRQVHLHYAPDADPTTYVTEIQFPVEYTG